MRYLYLYKEQTNYANFIQYPQSPEAVDPVWAYEAISFQNLSEPLALKG